MVNEQQVGGLVSLASEKGVALVICFILIGIVVWILRWVFRTSKDREDALAKIINVGMVNLTTAITDLADSVKDLRREMKIEIEKVHEANKFQRAEHEELRKDLRDGKCKAA